MYDIHYACRGWVWINRSLTCNHFLTWVALVLRGRDRLNSPSAMSGGLTPITPFIGREFMVVLTDSSSVLPSACCTYCRMRYLKSINPFLMCLGDFPRACDAQQSIICGVASAYWAETEVVAIMHSNLLWDRLWDCNRRKGCILGDSTSSPKAIKNRKLRPNGQTYSPYTSIDVFCLLPRLKLALQDTRKQSTKATYKILQNWRLLHADYWIIFRRKYIVSEGTYIEAPIYFIGMNNTNILALYIYDTINICIHGYQ